MIRITETSLDARLTYSSPRTAWIAPFSYIVCISLSPFDPARSLTIYNTAAGHHGLTVGITWWILGAILSLSYFTLLFRMFKGKVRLEGEGY